MPKENTGAGTRIAEHGEWTGWVKRSARDRWWWSLKHSDQTVARAPAGVKVREDAAHRVLTLVTGLAALDEVMVVREERDRARADNLELQKDLHEKETVRQERDRAESNAESLRRTNRDIEARAQREAREAATRSRRKTALMMVVGIVALAIGYVLGAVV